MEYEGKQQIERLEGGFSLTEVKLVQTYEDNRQLFTCKDRSKPSLLTINADGHVMIKNSDSAFWDYLGRYVQ